jgi:hypothetical protein
MLLHRISFILNFNWKARKITLKKVTVPARTRVSVYRRRGVFSLFFKENPVEGENI